VGFSTGFAEFESDGLSRTDDPATMGLVNMQTRLPRPPCQVPQSCDVQKRRLHGMDNPTENDAVAATP
jgi:hypothetical protein